MLPFWLIQAHACTCTDYWDKMALTILIWCIHILLFCIRSLLVMASLLLNSLVENPPLSTSCCLGTMCRPGWVVSLSIITKNSQRTCRHKNVLLELRILDSNIAATSHAGIGQSDPHAHGVHMFYRPIRCTLLSEWIHMKWRGLYTGPTAITSSRELWNYSHVEIQVCFVV